MLRFQAVRHIRYGAIVAASVLVLGGCDMLNLESRQEADRRMPALNPVGRTVLVAQADQQDPLLRQPVSQPLAYSSPEVYETAAMPSELPQESAPAVSNTMQNNAAAQHSEDRIPNAVPASSETEEEFGLFSWMVDWFTDDREEEAPVTAPVETANAGGVRYTLPGNVEILQQENSGLQAQEQDYPDLAGTPQRPAYDAPGSSNEVFSALEIQRQQAEATRQQLVTGAEEIEVASQPKSAELTDFVADDAGGWHTLSQQEGEYATQDAENAPIIVPSLEEVSPELANAAPEAVKSPPLPSNASPARRPIGLGAVPEDASVSLAPPPAAPAMDAYTAEILGERILPLEETQVVTAQPASSPQPAVAPIDVAPPASPVLQPVLSPSPVAMQAAPAPAYYPAEPVYPVEQTYDAPPQESWPPYQPEEPAYAQEIPAVQVSEVPYANAPAMMEPAYEAPPEAPVREQRRTLYHPEYSYYENEPPVRLRPPAPVARQTVFLPESRYARRRLKP